MVFSSKHRDKDRLYVALYIRGGAPKMPGGEDKFHWAILVGPKLEDNNTRGRRFHAKENVQTIPNVWEYNEEETKTLQTMRLLTRIQIGKVRDMTALESVLRGVPIRAGAVDGWNCVAWVREALEMIANNDTAMGTAVLDWAKVRDAAMAFTQSKIDSHRFDGKAEVKFGMDKAPTYDLIEGKELIA
ncbi:hypothetical protein SEPCBS57363_006417 [Sporothrix epigloea]|uniref:Uncharacterized protein n=1 Tax=Sporothrix epigloea TaxID=1892477 RepID=A0ABP0E5I9_9PEZI